jgi:hypothetical protein
VGERRSRNLSVGVRHLCHDGISARRLVAVDELAMTQKTPVLGTGGIAEVLAH